MEVTPSGAAEVDAPLRSQETKEALLKWQREQFIQRAELTRALAQAQFHHIDESRNAASYMGLVSVLASIHATECSTLYMRCPYLDPLFLRVRTHKLPQGGIFVSKERSIDTDQSRRSLGITSRPKYILFRRKDP